MPTLVVDLRVSHCKSVQPCPLWRCVTMGGRWTTCSAPNLVVGSTCMSLTHNCYGATWWWFPPACHKHTFAAVLHGLVCWGSEPEQSLAKTITYEEPGQGCAAMCGSARPHDGKWLAGPMRASCLQGSCCGLRAGCVFDQSPAGLLGAGPFVQA